jgi:hypothetical protein
LRPGPVGLLLVGLLLVELKLEVADLIFEDQQPADPRQRQSFLGKAYDSFNYSNINSGVSALAAIRSCRLDHRFGIQPTKERRLDIEHVGDLAHGVQRSVVIIERSRRGPRFFRRGSGSWHRSRRDTDLCLSSR